MDGPFKYYKGILYLYAFTKSWVQKLNWKPAMQSKTGVYTISEEHLSPAILQDVLRWMYLYTISNMPDKVPQLLEAAEYFQMAALKDSCEDILTRQLSVENCVQMMNTAFLFNIPTLKKKALDLFLPNRETVLANKDGWQDKIANIPQCVQELLGLEPKAALQ